MKKQLFIFIAILGFGVQLAAQNDFDSLNDKERIALRPMLMYSPDLTDNGKLALRNKVAQIVSLNGLGATGSESRFVMSAKALLIDANVVESIPPMFVYTMEITFYIVDNIDHKIFSQYTVTLKGTGNSEEKAISAIVQQINPRDARIGAFIEKGKKSILEYYNTNCDIIIEKATALIATGEKEKGMDLLLRVPPVSRECYDKAMQKVRDAGGDPAKGIVIGSDNSTSTTQADKVENDDGSLNWIEN